MRLFAVESYDKLTGRTRDQRIVAATSEQEARATYRTLTDKLALDIRASEIFVGQSPRVIAPPMITDKAVQDLRIAYVDHDDGRDEVLAMILEWYLADREIRRSSLGHAG